MKYSELIRRLSKISDEPKSEARFILERCFSISPSQIPILGDRELEDSVLEQILVRREGHVPLQYIFGKWEFMGNEFCVNENCLIPRADTELLVENALDFVKKGDRVADFCTGSGCIGLSILLHSPLEKISLVDISEGAIDVAIKNARHHGLFDRCTFILSDIRKLPRNEKYDLILSNPPYIPTRDLDTLSKEVQREPRLALDGGENGLDIISFLIGDGLELLKPQGKMLIEFGYDQGEIMDTLLGKIKADGKIASYKIKQDYGGNPRLAIIEK